MSIKCGAAAAALAVGFVSIAPASAQLIIPTRAVQQPGNAPDPFTGNIYGSVAYEYNIGRYEVTNAQYAVFLNAIAATDTFEVYSPGMAIARAGSPGSYTYTANPNRAQHPVEYIIYWDAIRFANWLHNGQPNGAQDNTTTEDGAYTLTAKGISENTVTRNPGWRWAIPSANEWYKAAYHRPRENGGAIGDYWLYPAFYDNIPAANFDNILGDTAPVGSFANNYTFRALYDLAGNVAEWTEETVEGSDQIYGILRGGSFSSPLYALRSDNFDANGRDNEIGRIGFRVCRFPACPADRNDNLVVDVPDIFVFLTSWFSQDFPDCDFNHDDRTDVADIFAFLSAWFAGC